MVPLPPPLTVSREGLLATSEWRLFESKVYAKSQGDEDILSQVAICCVPIWIVYGRTTVFFFPVIPS